MEQLSLFDTPGVVALRGTGVRGPGVVAGRGRGRSRRRDAGRDEFRRAHARHRDWGKAVRHARTLYREFHSAPDSGPPSTPEEQQRAERECAEKRRVQRECAERRRFGRRCAERDRVERECAERRRFGRRCAERDRAEQECPEQQRLEERRVRRSMPRSSASGGGVPRVPITRRRFALSTRARPQRSIRLGRRLVLPRRHRVSRPRPPPAPASARLLVPRARPPAVRPSVRPPARLPVRLPARLPRLPRLCSVRYSPHCGRPGNCVDLCGGKGVERPREWA